MGQDFQDIQYDAILKKNHGKAENTIQNKKYNFSVIKFAKHA